MLPILLKLAIKMRIALVVQRPNAVSIVGTLVESSLIEEMFFI